MLRPRAAALATTVLLFALTSAQQSCYYPDGSLSKDVPCNPQAGTSSCCPQSGFCLGSGLCIGTGLLMRGSCTDNSWKDPSCPQYCQKQDTDKASILLPCSSDSTSNTYACGITNSDACSSNKGTITLKPGSDFGVVLRPAQVSALVGSQISATAASLASVTVTVAPGNVGLYTGGQMAGLAAGLVLPFLAALAAVIILYIREKRKYSSASLMLKLPDDNKSDFNWSQKSRHNSAGTHHSHHSSQHPQSPGSALRSPTHSTFHHTTTNLRSPTLEHPHHSQMERSESVASRTGTIHVSMSPRPTPRALVPSWSTRSTDATLTRDSIRSRNTASPNMSTFLEMKAKTRQQELEAARLAERHENMVTEYNRSMAKQHSSGASGIGTPSLPGTPGTGELVFPRPPLPVHEMDPGQGGVVVHEMGDGRKSVYQPPADPTAK